MNQAKVCHITTVHNRYDTRIFRKQCMSLSEQFDVYLVVADGKGNEIINNINIVDIGKRENSRIKRFFSDSAKAFQKAVEIDASIYHLHDPELMPVGLKLKKLNKFIVFDAHEDLPKQIQSKHYLNRFSRTVLSNLILFYEHRNCRKYDFILTATPAIRDKFLPLNKKTVDINNYPLIDELYSISNWKDKKNEVCYVGRITLVRGIENLIKSFETVQNCRLNLIGGYNTSETRNRIQKSLGWEKINELGELDRKNLQQVMSQCKGGIVTFLPVPNHIEAQPNKMFEYMSAGLPVIASNFPLWRDIIEGNQCGICVDPLKPEELSKAINYLVENNTKAEEMGNNGRKAVIEKYNWSSEARKLLSVYSELLNNQNN